MKPLRSFWRVFWSDRRAAAAAVFLLAEILLVLLLGKLISDAVL